VQVAEPAVGVGELAEQEGAAVAQPRHVPAELVPGVRLGDRGRPGGDVRADQQVDAVRAAQPVGIETEVARQGLVEHEQARLGRVLRLPGHGHLRELPGEPVPEVDGRWQRDAHDVDGTSPNPSLRLPCW
jgi:hypothetical protein